MRDIRRKVVMSVSMQCPASAHGPAAGGGDPKIAKDGTRITKDLDS
jgi:hypothetical protein